MSKKKDDRRAQIEELIKTKKQLDVNQLAELFQVTTETIRNDLEFLENKGVLIRTHGGAVFQMATLEPSMDIRKQDRIQEKNELARKALDLIKDGSIIYIDGASTSLALAHLLNLKNNCTIVTNNIELVNSLYESKHDVYLIGGKVSKKGHRSYGDFTLQMIRPFHFNVCILGMDGCYNTKAPAQMNIEEVILDDIVLKNSDYSILISDASKFSLNARFKYAEFKDFDCLITTKIPDFYKQYIDTRTIIETEK